LDTAFRDPFQSYRYAQKPAPAAPKSPAGPVASKTVEPPKATLSGILWGDEPVAILKQDGQTELVKKGAAVWDLKVLKIEKNQVVVQKQGRRFTLGY
jgi:type II secretory pathway component PulC